MKKIYNIFVIAFIVLILSSCSTSSLESIAKTNPSVVVEDKSVAKWLDVESINSFIRQDGMIELEIIAKNIDSNAKIFTYKIDWFDQNEMTIKSITSKWRIIQVEGKRGVTIREISPSHNAINYKIRINTPNKEDSKREMNVNVKEYRGE